MKTPLLQAKRVQFAVSVLAAVCVCTTAQLTYHNDANTNSYTLNIPNSQQSFVRHFNGGGAGLQQQQQQHRLQPQRVNNNIYSVE